MQVLYQKTDDNPRYEVNSREKRSVFSVFHPPTGCLAEHVDAHAYSQLPAGSNIKQFRTLTESYRWAKSALKLVSPYKRARSRFNPDPARVWQQCRGQLTADELLKVSCRDDLCAVGTTDGVEWRVLDEDDTWVEVPHVCHVRIDVDMPFAWKNERDDLVGEACRVCVEVASEAGIVPAFFLTGSKGFALYIPLPAPATPGRAKPLADGWVEALRARRVTADKQNLNSNMRLPLGIHALTGSLGAPFDPETLEVLPADVWIDTALRALGSEARTGRELPEATMTVTQAPAKPAPARNTTNGKKCRKGRVRPEVMAKCADILSNGLTPGAVNDGLMLGHYMYAWRIIHGEMDESLRGFIEYVRELPCHEKAGEREAKVRCAWDNFRWYERGERREPAPLDWSVCPWDDRELTEWLSAVPACTRKDRRRNMRLVARAILVLLRLHKPVSVRRVRLALGAMPPLDNRCLLLSLRAVQNIMNALPEFDRWTPNRRWDSDLSALGGYEVPLCYREIDSGGCPPLP